MPNFPLGDSQKVPYSLIETDDKHNTVPSDPTDVITVVSSDTDMATVVPDATPNAGTSASGFIVAGSKIGTVTITATLTPADGGPALTAQDLIDIIPGKASGLSFGLGAPVAQ